MKIYYFDGMRHSSMYSAPNFGDELNVYLWHKIFPQLDTQHPDVNFIGIGTLLNNRLNRAIPADEKKIVFGSGVGYGDLPNIDKNWDIMCVRGLISAQKLGLDPRLGITDPAILISDYFSHGKEKQYEYSYIPHYMSAIINGEGWQSICKDLGINYIDPTNSTAEVLQEIAQTKILLAEAMHGAIVADAFRVPWIPIKTHNRILEGKWQDWLSTLEIDYRPYRLRRFATIISNSNSQPIRQIDYAFLRAQMSLAIKEGTPNLSPLKRHRDLKERILEKVELLTKKYFDSTT